MKVSELLQNEICYFYADISFLELSSFGIQLGGNICYFRTVNPNVKYGLFPGYLLVGIYDYFTQYPDLAIESIKCHEFVTNQRLCFQFRLRGKEKFSFLGSEKVGLLEFPHMTVSHFIQRDDNDIVNYFSDGIYAISNLKMPISTKVKNIRHLAITELLAPGNLFLDLFIELLKRIGKNYSDEELLDYYYKFNSRFIIVDIKDNPSYHEMESKIFLYKMRLPAYNLIPKEYRERAMDK